MRQNSDPTDGHARIARIVDYIFHHYDEDVSLETLAGVGHYSKDHLPILFKEVTGATPKQYSLALRLESAFHYLVIQPEKPVQIIALEGGFSSLSVFSRAIKNRYGYSPEEIRRLPHSRQMRLLHGAPERKPGSRRPDPAAGTARPEIQVVRKEAVKGVYLAAPFDDPGKIRAAFRALYALSRTGGATSGPTGAGPKFYGILTPHLRNTYRAFLATASSPAEFPPACSVGEIKGGMFARFTVSGDHRVVNRAAHYFYRQWLPASGFRIAGIAGFEDFEENPAEAPYDLLTRIIHIPIKPNL